jgi:hypothetical protein
MASFSITRRGLNRATDLLSSERPDDSGNYNHASIKICNDLIFMTPYPLIEIFENEL